MLKRQLQQEAIFRLEVTALDGADPELFRSIMGVKHFQHTVVDGGADLEFILENEDVLPAVIGHLTENDIHLRNLEKREPTLGDVFVQLVGMRMDEVEGAERG